MEKTPFYYYKEYNGDACKEPSFGWFWEEDMDEFSVYTQETYHTDYDSKTGIWSYEMSQDIIYRSELGYRVKLITEDQYLSLVNQTSKIDKARNAMNELFVELPELLKQ